MTLSRNRRMQQLTQQIHTMPIAPSVLRKAFDLFRETGELPELQRLAAAVIEQALRGGEPAQVAENPDSTVMRALLLKVVTEHELDPPERATPTMREHLFDEAVYGPPFVRRVARSALAWLVDGGGDVADPQFLAEMPRPRLGTVGTNVLGFPERLAQPPFVAQAQRLFARYARLSEDIANDPVRLNELAVAVVEFERTGDLPPAGALRDAVLADAEMAALRQHRRGQDVTTLMALLDAAARAKGANREVAVAEVQRFVRGRLGPRVNAG